MIEHVMCIDCGERPRKAGRRQCGRCTWLTEKRDPERERIKRREYKRRRRLRIGCTPRVVIAARTAAMKIIKAHQAAFPARRASSFVPTDTLKKPLKDRSRAALWAAVRDGRVTKPDRCSRCGIEASGYKLHAHHHDYAKPLDVVWVCSSCHALIDECWGRRNSDQRGEQRGIQT